MTAGSAQGPSIPLVDPWWWSFVGLDTATQDRVRPFYFLHGYQLSGGRAEGAPFRFLRLKSAEEVAWVLFELELELRVHTVLSAEEFLSLRSPDSQPVGEGVAIPPRRSGGGFGPRWIAYQ